MSSQPKFQPSNLWQYWGDHSWPSYWIDTWTETLLRAWFLPATMMIDITELQNFWQRWIKTFRQF